RAPQPPFSPPRFSCLPAASSRATRHKTTPALTFVLDPSFDRMDETRAMLAQDVVRRDLTPPED
ncbi:MAG: hypothetical protein AAFZ09_03365, partial [Pseudomonadota bacterium]